MTSPPQHPPRNRIVITTACSKGEMSWAHHANGAVRRPPSRRSSASYRAPRSHRSGTISTLDGTIPNNIGEIDHLIIDKVSGRVAYAVMSFGGFMVLEPGNGQGSVQPTRSASRPAPRQIAALSCISHFLSQSGRVQSCARKEILWARDLRSVSCCIIGERHTFRRIAGLEGMA